MHILIGITIFRSLSQVDIFTPVLVLHVGIFKAGEPLSGRGSCVDGGFQAPPPPHGYPRPWSVSAEFTPPFLPLLGLEKNLPRLTLGGGRDRDPNQPLPPPPPGWLTAWLATAGRFAAPPIGRHRYFSSRCRERTENKGIFLLVTKKSSMAIHHASQNLSPIQKRGVEVGSKFGAPPTAF